MSEKCSAGRMSVYFTDWRAEVREKLLAWWDARHTRCASVVSIPFVVTFKSLGLPASELVLNVYSPGNTIMMSLHLIDWDGRGRVSAVVMHARRDECRDFFKPDGVASFFIPREDDKPARDFLASFVFRIDWEDVISEHSPTA